MKMKRIVNTNPDAARAYLTPDSTKMLGIIMGIKLLLSVAFLFMTRIEGYTGLSAVLFYLVMFALLYDVCSFYQVCLQIAQSIFIGFLLFLLLLMGIIFLADYALGALASFIPTSAAGETVSMLIMALICLIPLVIDAVRMVKFLLHPAKKEA